jgi:hypothetical protein
LGSLTSTAEKQNTTKPKPKTPHTPRTKPKKALARQQAEKECNKFPL